MLASLKSFFSLLKLSLGFLVVGIVALNVGAYLDKGYIEQVLAAGKPLYMDTGPQMAMVFGYFAIFFGLLGILVHHYFEHYHFHGDDSES